VNTYEWYRQRVYHLGGEHDPSDRNAAFAMALEWGDKIPLGIIYRNNRPTFEERFPILSGLPLVKQEQFNREKLERTLAGFR
jgi:2-oxoglutarate ferredoxin oxidoreductase subunit beta